MCTCVLHTQYVVLKYAVTIHLFIFHPLVLPFVVIYVCDAVSASLWLLIHISCAVTSCVVSWHRFSLVSFSFICTFLFLRPLVVQVNGINVEPCTHEEVVSTKPKLRQGTIRLLPPPAPPCPVVTADSCTAAYSSSSSSPASSAAAVHHIHLLLLQARNERFLLRRRRRSKKHKWKEEKGGFIFLAGCHSARCFGRSVSSYWQMFLLMEARCLTINAIISSNLRFPRCAKLTEVFESPCCQRRFSAVPVF